MSKGKSSSPKPDEGGGDEEGFVSILFRLMKSLIIETYKITNTINHMNSMFFFYLFSGLGKIANAQVFHCIWFRHRKL